MTYFARACLPLCFSPIFSFYAMINGVEKNGVYVGLYLIFCVINILVTLFLWSRNKRKKEIK